MSEHTVYVIEFATTARPGICYSAKQKTLFEKLLGKTPVWFDSASKQKKDGKSYPSFRWGLIGRAVKYSLHGSCTLAPVPIRLIAPAPPGGLQIATLTACGTERIFTDTYRQLRG